MQENTLIERAEAAMKARDWDSAIALWAELRKLAPARPKGYDRAALALRSAGRFADSDAMVRASAERFGLRAGHLITMADTAMDQADWPTAIGRWADLRARFPEAVQGYARAIQALRRLDLLDEAEMLGRLALKRIGAHPQVLANHAETAMERQDFSVACDRWAQLRSADPADPRGYARGIVALEKAGRAHEIETFLLEAVRHSPSDRLCSLFLKNARNLPLQEQIERTRLVHETGLPCPDFSGSLRLFDMAESDPRLAAILNGETIRPAKHDGPIRAVFYFPTVTQTDNLLPLYERMVEDARFAPVILCSRNRSRAAADSYEFHSRKYPEAEGHVVIDGGTHVEHNTSLYDLDPDIVFYHTPYSQSGNFPFFLRADFVARHSHLGHVNYAYMLLTLGAKNTHTYLNDHVRSCDMIFCECPVSAATYRKIVDNDRVFMTGYPKFDTFRKYLDPLAFEDFVAGREVLDVAWTPHWQMAEDPTGGTHTSNFLLYYKTLLEISARPDVRLHVRPHPLLRSRLNTIGLMSFEEYDAVMEAFRQTGAVVHPPNEGQPYIEPLAQSAILISDFSSLIPEFMISQRPIIFCRTEDVWNNGKWISPFAKEMLEETTYITDTPDDMTQALSTLLSECKHPKGVKIKEFTARHGLFPAGSASGRICDAINQWMQDYPE